MSHVQMLEEIERQEHYAGRTNEAVWCEDAVLGSIREDEEECGCRGSGWILSPYDTWHTCFAHFEGQAHPDDQEAREIEWGQAMADDVEADMAAEEIAFLRASYFEAKVNPEGAL